ncbi:MAG: HEAT repeat domain-containing protein [Verrucomicrobia bacterium]|nr:HEAT repeat domain-containing protein [Verrucomicrobiota bacterium]
MPISKLKLTLMVALWCGGIHSSFGQAPATGQEAKLIAILKSNAEYNAKAEACRDLAIIGTADAVPALAALLADEKLAHMARYGMETIPGPAVDLALRAALGTLKGLPLVGVIGSLGVRHDEKAVAALTGLLQAPDAEVAQAAARALGMIGTADAAKPLLGLLPTVAAPNQLAVCEGLFRCAETLAAKGQPDQAIVIYDTLRNLNVAPHQVFAGAWRGAILTRQKDGLALLLEAFRSEASLLVTAAERIAIEMKVAEVSKVLADELTKVPAERQIMLCNVLGKRGDVAALPGLLGLAKAGDKAARVAAIRAATEIGNAGAAVPLIELLKDADGDVAQAASAGLAGLPGAEVDATVIRMLDAPDPALKLKMLEMVSQRRIVTARPLLLKIREDKDNKDEALRSAAIRCYAELASEADLAILLEKVVANTNAGEIGAIEKALAAICAAAGNPQDCAQKLVAALPKAGPEAKPALLRTLGVAGGADALKAVRGTVDDSNKDVHTAAIRVLCEWKTGDAAPLLLDLAKSSSGQVDKILSLRGYLGMATRQDLPAPARLAICHESAPLIQRDDERLLLLAALANLADAASLGLIVPCLDVPAVKREAVATVITVAERRPKNQNVDITRAALKKAAALASDNPDLSKRAQDLLQQMENEK